MIRNPHLEEDMSLNTPFEWGGDGDGALDSGRNVKHGSYNGQSRNLLIVILILSFFIGIIVNFVFCLQSIRLPVLW